MAEGGTPSDYINLKYIYQVTDPAHFDSMFVTALAARIAASIASGLYGDAESAKALTELSELTIAKAKAANVIEGVPWRNDPVYKATVGFLAKSEKAGVDDETIARAFREVYAVYRNALLREYAWGFATKRVALVVLEDAPASGYLYQYTLPTDYLDAQDVNYSEAPEYPPFGCPPLPPIRYAIENGVLLTDSDSVILTYTALVTDSTKFDAQFVTALAARIAAHMATGLYGNAALAANLVKIAEIEVGKARMADATEGTPQVARRERSWIDAR